MSHDTAVRQHDGEVRTLLLIESEAAVRRFLADNLKADGYAVVERESCDERLLRGFPDAIVVDARTPDGLRFIADVRRADGVHGDPRVPLLALGNGGGELDAIRAFEHGADQYLPRPFSYLELRVRLQAMLRVRERGAPARTTLGPLTIDRAERTVTLHGRLIPTTQKEYALLATLMSEPTRVFTKEALLRGVWGYKSLGLTRTLDSHVCRLRRKLGVHGERYLVNVWGVGYRLLDHEEVTA